MVAAAAPQLLEELGIPAPQPPRRRRGARIGARLRAGAQWLSGRAPSRRIPRPGPPGHAAAAAGLATTPPPGIGPAGGSPTEARVPAAWRRIVPTRHAAAAPAAPSGNPTPARSGHPPAAARSRAGGTADAPGTGGPSATRWLTDTAGKPAPATPAADRRSSGPVATARAGSTSAPARPRPGDRRRTRGPALTPVPAPAAARRGADARPAANPASVRPAEPSGSTPSGRAAPPAPRGGLRGTVPGGVRAVVPVGASTSPRVGAPEAAEPRWPELPAAAPADTGPWTALPDPLPPVSDRRRPFAARWQAELTAE